MANSHQSIPLLMRLPCLFLQMPRLENVFDLRLYRHFGVRYKYRSLIHGENLNTTQLRGISHTTGN